MEYKKNKNKYMNGFRDLSFAIYRKFGNTEKRHYPTHIPVESSTSLHQ